MGIGGVDLLDGEHVRWEGRPVRHPLLRTQDALVFPQSILGAVFGVAAPVGFMVVDGAPPSLIALVGIPLVLLGFYAVVGRYLIRLIVSRRTRYVLTDRRLLIIGGLFGTRVTSTYLRLLRPPIVIEAPDRSGSLAFGAFPTAWDELKRNSRWSWVSKPSNEPVLWHIPDVSRVRDLVADAQRLHGAQPW
jgi:hypothetical protein